MKNPIHVSLKFLIICMSLHSFFMNAQEELISEKINILKTYDREHLHRIAMPMGGIGTGTVSLGGSGELRDWEIMNVPGKNYSTVTTGNDAPFFAIYTKKKNEAPKTKALLGPIHHSDYQHYEGRSVNHHGLPRFRDASFEATYPFGIVNLSDDSMPVKIKMIGYNPFIPGNADASGIPIAIIKYEVENISDVDIDVSISGNIRNFLEKTVKNIHLTGKAILFQQEQKKTKTNTVLQIIFLEFTCTQTVLRKLLLRGERCRFPHQMKMLQT